MDIQVFHEIDSSDRTHRVKVNYGDGLVEGEWTPVYTDARCVNRGEWVGRCSDTEEIKSVGVYFMQPVSVVPLPAHWETVGKPIREFPVTARAEDYPGAATNCEMYEVFRDFVRQPLSLAIGWKISAPKYLNKSARNRNKKKKASKAKAQTVIVDF